jgi:thiol-disulfide isomerase/thioredoxin
MKPRVFLTLTLGLALVAPACTGKSGAETAGQTIRAATTYNVTSYRAADRRTPKSWSGVDLQGRRLRSRDFRGAVTVVNFWASWCGPCRVEQPDFQKVWTSYKDKGVRFLGVTVRDTLTNALSHVEEFRVTYPSVFTKNDNTIAYKFRVLFVPSSFVLDRSGRIAAKIIGPTNEQDLRRLIDGELSG